MITEQKWNAMLAGKVGIEEIVQTYTPKHKDHWVNILLKGVCWRCEELEVNKK